MDASRLSDLYEIQKLKARYFRCMDLRLWDEFRDVFTEDLELYVENTKTPQAKQPTVKGADNLVKLPGRLRPAQGDGPPRPHARDRVPRRGSRKRHLVHVRLGGRPGPRLRGAGLRSLPRTLRPLPGRQIAHLAGPADPAARGFRAASGVEPGGVARPRHAAGRDRGNHTRPRHLAHRRHQPEGAPAGAREP